MLGLLITLPIFHQRLHNSSELSPVAQQVVAENSAAALTLAADSCSICCVMPGGAVPVESTSSIEFITGIQTGMAIPSLSFPLRHLLDSSTSRGPPA